MTPPRGARISPFLFASRPVPGAPDLPTSGRRACIAEAEAALEGRFEVLGFGVLDFGRPVRWHLDPVSGFHWPLVAHHRLTPMPWVADIKVPWEASRLHWLVALTRAARSTGDPRFLDGAHELLGEWTAANPVGWGVNWVNAMEAGIRAVNLVWAAEIARDPRVDALAAGLLCWHGRHIAEHLEYSPRLTSNHYLANLVGLLYAGAALRHTARGRTWLRFASWAFQRETIKQFGEDGMNFEASTVYHRLSTELVLCALIALSRLGEPISPVVRERFERSLDVLAVLARPDGLLPPIGDDDSGLVMNLASQRHPRDPWPIVEAGLAVLQPDRHGSGPPGEFAQWAVGTGVDIERSTRARTLSRSGIHVLQNDDLWCLIDCGAVGQRGNGGHAHNDTLSFVLGVRGREAITDPGTFTYTGDPSLRNDFRRTRAHASVEVDGEEINRFVGDQLFTLHEDDHPETTEIEFGPARQRVVASHAGYGRLPDPVIHQRTWDLSGRGLVVADELRCTGRHRALVSFPLAAGAEVTVTGSDATIRLDGAGLDLRQVGGTPLALAAEPAFVSTQYGRRQPSLTLRAPVAVTGSTSWAFELRALQ